jgi:hypothetical protein
LVCNVIVAHISVLLYLDAAEAVKVRSQRKILQ